MAREPDIRTTILAGLALGILVLLAVSALAISTSRQASTTPVWSAVLIMGTLAALVVLLILEPQSGSESEERELVISSCPACGKSTIDEWRLCPHCGQMLECDMSIPMRGDRTHG